MCVDSKTIFQRSFARKVRLRSAATKNEQMIHFFKPRTQLWKNKRKISTTATATQKTTSFSTFVRSVSAEIWLLLKGVWKKNVLKK